MDFIDKDIQTGYRYADCAQDSRNNEKLLRQNFAGMAFPPNPTTGQYCYRIDMNPHRMFIYNGITWVDIASTSLVSQDVRNSAGELPTLYDRLNVSLNPDGTLKIPAQANVTEWVKNSALQFYYVDGKTFNVKQDWTKVFTAGRGIKAVMKTVAYSYVVSSEYNPVSDRTVIIINDNILDNTLSYIEYSIIQDSMPNYAQKDIVTKEISAHNIDKASHADIRNEIKELNKIPMATTERISHLESIVADATLTLDVNKMSQYGYDGMITETFLSPTDSIDQTVVQVTQITTGSNVICVNTSDGLIIGSFYQLNDNISQETVQIQNINTNNGIIQVTLVDVIKGTFNPQSVRLYRTSATIINGACYGGGNSNEKSWDANISFSGTIITNEVDAKATFGDFSGFQVKGMRYTNGKIIVGSSSIGITLSNPSGNPANAWSWVKSE